MKQKLIVVAGPTAVGKTQLAIELAKKYNGELINADSRQIYKYLSIGTNKGPIQNSSLEYNKAHLKKELQDINANVLNLTIKQIDSIPIHLIDFLDPNENFSAFDFKKLAYFAIDDIISRNKMPILVGGTGLYIDAIVKNYDELSNNVAPNIEYRNYLKNFTLKELQNLLQSKAKNIFEKLNYSDQNNPQRLQRILEKINLLEGQGLKIEENLDKIFGTNSKPKYNCVFVYKSYNWENLKTKIHLRAREMFDDGIISETENLLKMGYSKDCPALSAVGYSFVIKFLDNQISLENCISLVANSHIKYARKQRTWFEGKNRNYNLVYVSSVSDVSPNLLQ